MSEPIKTVPAVQYTAEGIEITIKVKQFNVTTLDPVKPGFIASIIQSLPPELLLMAMAKFNSYMDKMNHEPEVKEVKLPESITFISPEGKNIDHLVNLTDRLGDIIVTGMNKLELPEDRYNVTIQVDDDLPIEIPVPYTGSLVQFLVENGYMNKTITSYRVIYK